jgi:lipopolysaccharide/colanic/teichoic acid biosynthesis glycosyltransferase
LTTTPFSHSEALAWADTGGGRRFQNSVKRLLDLIFSGLLLLLLLPAGCVCALLVYIVSPGPVIFATRRLGKNGKPFNLYKFRSMYAGAPDWRNPDGSTFNSEEDPRVTPIGRFLRKTSLDELPQLWNVALGDMSLVGPRPDQVDQLRYYTEREKTKLSVNPGITGLAQISGRNTITWEARKALDVEYVKRQSILFDLIIMCKTIPYVLKREGVNSSSASRLEV